MRKWLAVFTAILCLAGVQLFPAEASGSTSSTKISAQKSSKKKKSTKKAAPPIPDLTPAGLPNVLSESVLVIDLHTGEEIFAKNADKKRAIASISKLAAAIAVRKAGLDLEGFTEITAQDAEIAKRGSKPHIKVGWKISNRDLLYSSLIASENRAVPAMGRGAGLNEKKLVAEMNAVAKSLGLKNTFFDETTGLSYNNKSTAREVAKLLKAAMEDEVLADAMTRMTFEINPIEPANTPVNVWNTNHLLRTDKYKVLGGKTGFNNEAGYCLTTSLSVGDRDIIIVILGAHQPLTRYGDVSRIVKWLSAKETIASASPAEKK